MSSDQNNAYAPFARKIPICFRFSCPKMQTFRAQSWTTPRGVLDADGSRTWVVYCICCHKRKQNKTRQDTMKPIFSLLVAYCVLLLISNASAQCFPVGCKTACYGSCDGCRNRCSSPEATNPNCVEDCDNACRDCIFDCSTCKATLR